MLAVGERPAQAGLIEPRYSTVGLVAAERALIASADAARPVGTVAAAEIDRAVARYQALGDDQHTMVRELCGSSNPVQVVRAPAGTGKTFALRVAHEAWQAADIPVAGVALSARAARELNQQTGIPASTVAAVELGFTRGYGLPHRGVVVVDEAGMVGTRSLALLAEQAALAEAKIVLVGDDRQLPEIQAGGAFHALAERLDPIEPRDVHRQRHGWDRDALEHLRSGDLELWADAYADHQRIVVSEDGPTAHERMVEDWWRAQPGEDVLMLALRRVDVAELNRGARERLRDAGGLEGPDVDFGDRAFAVGDRVVSTRNDRSSGTVNGQRGTVASVSPNSVTIQPDKHHAGEVWIAHDQLEQGDLDHAYAMTVHRAQGATVDRTLVLADDTSYREWAYTALSRHRGSTTLYVTADTLADDTGQPVGDPTDGLVRLLSQSRAKQLALEPPAPDEPLTLAFELRDLGMDPAADIGLGR